MTGPATVSPRMGLVCFAFGVATVPYDGQLPAGQLPGPMLIRLLADLGMSQAAARSVLLRMRREGWIEARRSGREARYRLAPAIGLAQARIEAQLRGRRPAWGGAFSGILYEVPEQARSFRDRLRRTAQLLGYATLHPGLLIAASDRWEELTGLLPPAPADSQLLRTQLTLSMADSRQIAARLWRLDELADRYRSVAATAAKQVEIADRNPAGPQALRAFAAAALPIFEVSTDDPDLPAELLPADWPGSQLGMVLYQAFQAFHPLMADYLASLVSQGG